MFKQRQCLASLLPLRKISSGEMAGRMEITIPRADDFHHHFRDGDVLKDTVRHATRMFRRAVREYSVQYRGTCRQGFIAQRGAWSIVYP